MEKLIPALTRLQDLVVLSHSENLQLPQIAVIGSQSSGKSSVLENILGRDILPRGTGIVTRCPLILQLLSTSSNPNTSQTSDSEFVKFGHLPNRIFSDMEEVKTIITSETATRTDNDKVVSSDPIHIKFYSPNVLNLTLIDLPGISKVPVGNQPLDIENQIIKIILEYIKKPDCLILAISPANVDLANSESLRLALQVDPNRHRTIGVLTKIDIMDQGTNVVDILHGRELPLKYGYYAIVSRNQRDNIQKKDIKLALKDEENFFNNSAIYAPYLKRCGTRKLSQCLSHILAQQFLLALPTIRKYISDEMTKMQDAIPSMELHNDTDKCQFMIDFTTTYMENFCGAIDGRSANSNNLSAGAKIHVIFTQLMDKLQSFDPLHGLTDEDIRCLTLNSQGLQPGIFINNFAIESIIRHQQSYLDRYCLDYSERVCDQLLSLALDIQMPHMDYYPYLKKEVHNIANQVIMEIRETCTKSIKVWLEAEKIGLSRDYDVIVLEKKKEEPVNAQKYIPNLHKYTQKTPAKQDIQANGNDRSIVSQDLVTESIKFQSIEDKINITKQIIVINMNSITINLADIAPKMINLLIVKRVQNSLQTQMLRTFIQPEKLSIVAKVSDAYHNMKDAARVKLKYMTESMDIINELKSF